MGVTGNHRLMPEDDDQGLPLGVVAHVEVSEPVDLPEREFCRHDLPTTVCDLCI